MYGRRGLCDLHELAGSRIRIGEGAAGDKFHGAALSASSVARKRALVRWILKADTSGTSAKGQWTPAAEHAAQSLKRPVSETLHMNGPSRMRTARPSIAHEMLPKDSPAEKIGPPEDRVRRTEQLPWPASTNVRARRGKSSPIANYLLARF